MMTTNETLSINLNYGEGDMARRCNGLASASHSVASLSIL